MKTFKEYLDQRFKARAEARTRSWGLKIVDYEVYRLRYNVATANQIVQTTLMLIIAFILGMTYAALLFQQYN